MTGSSLRQDVEAIKTWLREHAPPLYERLANAPPATTRDVVKLENELSVHLPEDFAEYLVITGGAMTFFEYQGLTLEQILDTWRRLETLRKKGTFDHHEIFDDGSDILRKVKWHPGWVPFAEDGGGNRFCLDMVPGPKGRVGQVLSWENAGGAVANGVRTFGQYLARYRELLESGNCRFDRDSFTFEEDDYIADARP